MEHDEISKTALSLMKSAGEPLETKEIQEKIVQHIKSTTRAKLFYRLTMLRADGKLKGKSVGSGKGVWIWWLEDKKA